AGWHLSWLGGPEAVLRKTSQYCHPELTGRITEWIRTGQAIEKGVYWDTPGQLHPCSVDETYPKWIQERKCPPNWFRSFYDKTAVGAQVLRGRGSPDLRDRDL
ncbi:MAG TPA: hypothetical protein VGR89_00725, partial [Puia sp.]|nr:hypothetical protein [Puia sp.]